jgi:hypothetical protein
VVDTAIVVVGVVDVEGEVVAVVEGKVLGARF